MNEELKMLLAMARGGQSDETILRALGGGAIYIPSWKRACRDVLIFQEFQQGKSMKQLSENYQISLCRIRAIIKQQRLEMKPSHPCHKSSPLKHPSSAS